MTDRRHEEEDAPRGDEAHGGERQHENARHEEPRRGEVGLYGSWADGVWLAVGTLSVLPAPVSRVVNRRVAGRAMLLAPIVGAVIGGAAALVVAAVTWLRPDVPLLAAVLGVAVVVALSGALHLDGLADMADGLGSRRDRETMLAIMRKGDVGPFGVAAVVLTLLVDVAALTACVTAGFGWQAIVIAAVASRTTLPWACRTTVPPARPEGLGAMVAGTVRPGVAAAVTLIGAGAMAGISATGPDGIRAAVVAAVAVLVAVGAGLVVVRRAVTAFGGITGDVLGAAVELGFGTALLVLALAG